MLHGVKQRLRLLSRDLWGLTDYTEAPHRYQRLRRNMVILGLMGTLVPIVIMAVVNQYQYQQALKAEMVHPLRVLVNRTKHSFEMFLTERLSAVNFIASAYPYDELADERTLNRVFQVMKREFGGFVDLGLIFGTGVQVSYVGPYDLRGKNYADQSWFHEVMIRGTYISDVFVGYRKFPHFVIAVERQVDGGSSWILRATIDTEKFNNLITSVGLDPDTDVFAVSPYNELQTPSKFFGKPLDRWPLPVPPPAKEPAVIETVDHRGNDILMAYIYSDFPNFILVAVRPREALLKTWHTFKTDLFLLSLVSIGIIFMVVFKVTGVFVRRIQEADERRQAVYHEMQYTSKLASIGRLATGVAHEINNPMAIINEKAGLMKDLIEFRPDFPEREKFLALTGSIAQSVDRVRNITHRLLGFARRMDVQFETLDLNELIREVLGFLEKEAFHRSIRVVLELEDSLPQISSDRGQLQQVFLNILNNAFEAVEDGGSVLVRTLDHDPDAVAVSIQDNGRGMSQDTQRHLFEPFFTTKKGYGTGLGLSITYGIVNKLGGGIEVQSKEGQGTTFTVTLPKRGKGTERGSHATVESPSGGR
jgi:two-component system NtrC family sensor kinase